MIIIAENKTNHLLIKQFLTTVKNATIIESIDDRSQDAGLHKAFDPNELSMYDQDETVEIKDLESLFRSPDTDTKQQSKARSLISIIEKGMIVPLLVAASYFGMQGGESYVAHKVSDLPQNNASYEQVLETMNSLDDVTPAGDITSGVDDMTIEYNRDISPDEVIDELLKDEGFKSLPYPDVKQWSVGYGTRVSDKKISKFSEAEGIKLKKEFKDLNGNTAKIKMWLKKKYPKWKQDFCNHYNVLNSNRDEISSADALKAARISLNSVMSKLRTTARYKFDGDDDNDIELYYDFLPVNVKEAMIDMGYNMGTAFTKKFKSFNQGMAVVGMILSKKILTELDIEMANDVISGAALEIIYNFNNNGSIKGPTKYAADLPKRAMKNYRKIAAGINPEDYTFEQARENFRNESYTIKSAYSHLFS